MQTGLTTGTSDRKIAHLGIGERIYPQAKSMEDLGHHMLGFNAVVDKDLSRGHTRGSIGLEYMHDNLKLVSNIYRRLSSWKDSPDFEKGVIIGDITPQRPKIEKNEDDPESLKNKSTDELIDEQQRLFKLLGVTGNFVRSYSEAEDKAEFIKSLGLSKVNGVLDSQINEYLKAYDGVNAEISSRLSVSKGTIIS